MKFGPWPLESDSESHSQHTPESPNHSADAHRQILPTSVSLAGGHATDKNEFTQRFVALRHLRLWFRDPACLLAQIVRRVKTLET